MKLPLERDSWKQYACQFKMADWPDWPLMILPIVWLFHVILWHPLKSWSTRVSRAWVNNNRSIQEVWLQIDCRITWLVFLASNHMSHFKVSKPTIIVIDFLQELIHIFSSYLQSMCNRKNYRNEDMEWHSLNPDRDFSMLVELTVEMYKHTTRDEYWQLFLKQPLFLHVHLLKAISRV